VIAWRLTKRKYATRERLLSGSGAKSAGGRWNRRGLAVVYASSSSSLALLEMLVHLDLTDLPASLVAAQIIIPNDIKPMEIRIDELGPAWREPDDERCVELGLRWLESMKSLVLLVPSAVNPIERNVLLNPGHHAIERCEAGEIVPVAYDPRLIALTASARSLREGVPAASSGRR
jgi:RES domain-containing protein